MALLAMMCTCPGARYITRNGSFQTYVEILCLWIENFFAVWVYKGLSCHDCVIQVLGQQMQQEGDPSWGGISALSRGPSPWHCSLLPRARGCPVDPISAGLQKKPLHPQGVHVWDLPQPKLGLVSSTEHPQCVSAQLTLPICICQGLEGIGCARG